MAGNAAPSASSTPASEGSPSSRRSGAAPPRATLYLGDTARVPYGTKSAEVVTRYSLKNAEFLLDRGIKLLVVACNTASAAALPHLSRELTVPVLGVIEPGAQAAAARGGPGRGRHRHAGHHPLRRVPAGAGGGAARRHGEGQACPLFVPLAEEGWVDGEVPRLVAREYLAEFARDGVDTLVLGCTHYPLLRGVLERAAAGVALVDSAETVAVMLAAGLAADDLRPHRRRGDGAPLLRHRRRPHTFERIAGRSSASRARARIRRVDLAAARDPAVAIQYPP